MLESEHDVILDADGTLGVLERPRSDLRSARVLLTPTRWGMPGCRPRRLPNLRGGAVAFDVFELVDQIALVLPPDRWTLVGGLMVQAHAGLAGVLHSVRRSMPIWWWRCGRVVTARRPGPSKGWVTHGTSRWTTLPRSIDSREAAIRWT